MRLLHVSDLHIDDGLPFLPTGRTHRKRLAGWANLRLRRASHFADAARKVELLGELAQEAKVDAVLCSGDYTALGTASELEKARSVIEPLTRAPGGLVTVPGNHDVYLDDALGVFEQHFDDFLESDLPELRRDGPWPLVRLYEGVAVVCVNSARPNPPIFRSSGVIPEAQLDGLRDALAHEALQESFVFVMTHYAPRLASGRPDSASHGLENANALLDACAAIRFGAIVHGHVHKCYSVNDPRCTIPLFSSGSTTQKGHEGLWLYEIEGERARAYRGRFNGQRYELATAPERNWSHQ
ncbi:MAG: metallophosphoesterase [Myxococcota bacterium]